MGRMQREKGKRFERQLATILRTYFPDAVVRRASQADRAHQSDVYIAGGPRLLSRLWLECQDAANPTPIAKLVQAEDDIDHAWRGDPVASDRLAVAVWHKLRAQDIHATMRAATFDTLRGCEVGACGSADVVLTIPLRDLLGIIKRAVAPDVPDARSADPAVPRATEAA